MLANHYTVGPVSITVCRSFEEATGLEPTTNALDQMLGEHVFVFNPGEVQDVAHRRGFTPAVLAHFMVGLAFAKLILGGAKSRFSNFVSAETVFDKFLTPKERHEAEELLLNVVALEFVHAMVQRLPGAPSMEEEFLRLRQLALKKFKVEVEEPQVGRYPRVLGAWGERVRNVVHAVLPYFREHVGAAG